MLYLIGLGLNEEGFSYEAYNAVKNSRKIYLESYTVELPFSKEELEQKLEKKVKEVKREYVEGNGAEKLVIEAKEDNVALLVYGSPLMATTHMSIIEECRNKKVPYRIVQGASILDAVGETGLSLYKFGKITSIPNFEIDVDSFIKVVKENEIINAHTLILIDIGLKFSQAFDKLERAAKSKRVEIKKMLVCSRLGTKRSSILYKPFKEFKKLRESLDKDVKAPFSFVIPSEVLNIIEEDVLKRLN